MKHVSRWIVGLLIVVAFLGNTLTADAVTVYAYDPSISNYCPSTITFAASMPQWSSGWRELIVRAVKDGRVVASARKAALGGSGTLSVSLRIPGSRGNWETRARAVDADNILLGSDSSSVIWARC